MARVTVNLVLFCASFHASLARTGYSEKVSLEAVVGHEGQVLMRQGAIKRETEAIQLDENRPKHRGQKEAVEAFADPHKIDDSWLSHVSIRFPNYIEKYPYFYACVFIGAALVFLMGVCFWVQYEDYKESQLRGKLAFARRQAMAAASALGRSSPHRMGAAFTPPHTVRPPTQAALRGASPFAAPSLQPAPKAFTAAAAAAAAAAEDDVTAVSDAGFSDVAISEAAPSEAARSDAVRSDARSMRSYGASSTRSDGARSMRSDGSRSLRPDAAAARSDGGRSSGLRSDVSRRVDGSRFRSPSPKPTVAEAAAAAALKGMQGMYALSDAVGNFTGVLAGENTTMPKLSSPFASADVTTASGTSTPRSRLSSQQPSVASSGHSSRIRSGTKLTVRVPEVIFASTTSWQEIGELSPGQQVVAAGPPEQVDAYTMVPIKPRGAVDLKALEAMDGY